MKARVGFGLILLAAVGALVWFALREPEPALAPPEPVPEKTAPPQGQTPTDKTSYGERPVFDDPRVTRLPDGRVIFNPAAETSRRIGSTPEPADGLRALNQVLALYRFVYKENPVGVENFEITAQLNGDNLMRIIFLAEDSPGLKAGELVDPWNTPIFFHALSGTQMELRSAGPDRTLFTDDDFLLGEEDL